MKISTWNVNSIRARLPGALAWLEEAAPDVVLLQEIKTLSEEFPGEPFGDVGYNAAVCGQKSYNGVAILAKRPIEDVRGRLPGDESDTEARYIEAFVAGVRVASIYAPNGNPVGSERFDYKLRWLARLGRHVEALLRDEEAFVLGGDYNVAPRDDDVYDPVAWADDALCRPESRAALRTIVHLGLTDAYRALHSEPGAYTFWDYQGGRWQRDEGLRIDHLLLSPQAADRLEACEIDRGPRGTPKASDHTPVWCRLRK